jgi:hypothetical protein
VEDLNKLDASDEQIHPIGEDPAWQESFYFNWADPEGESFTLARIGYRFHEEKVDGLVISLRGGELDCFYAPANLDSETPAADADPVRGMRSRRLLVTLEKPLERWRIRVDGKAGDGQKEVEPDLDVVFEASTPVFDYHSAGQRIAANMAGEHFEQSGVVRGRSNFRGESREIKAFGQRDKSWGVRDWANLTGWDWIAGQFASHWTFNIMRTREGENSFDNGFVFREGENRPIGRVEIEYHCPRQEHRYEEAELRIWEASGVSHRLLAHAITSVPILRGGVWLEETHTRFELVHSDVGHVPGVPGYGVVEHVWRPSKLAVVRRLPRIAAIARRFAR